MNCGWCGQDINGEPFSSTEVSGVMGGSFCGGGRWKDEVQLTPGYSVAFCCRGCEWAFQVDKHRLLGMTGKQAREHLKKVHLISPGHPGGKQSLECFNQSKEIARVIFSLFVDDGIPFSMN